MSAPESASAGSEAPSEGAGEAPSSEAAPSAAPAAPAKPSKPDEPFLVWARRSGYALVVVLILVFGALYVRGSSSSSAVLAPSESAEGTLRQLAKAEKGLRVEAACVLDAPADVVWGVVTDYEHFGEIFDPPVWKLRIEKVTREGDRNRLLGKGSSWFMDVPVDVEIRHSTEADGVRVASWANDEGEMLNRGSWRIVPIGADKSRIVYEAQVKPKGVPAFLVNNVLLTEVKHVLADVREAVAQRKAR